MGNVNLERWRGKRDPEAVDPAAIQFTTRPARSCKNCLFDRQWWTVCEKANAIAEKAGLVGCEKGKVIYVPKKLDPRQITIEGCQ